MPLVGTLRTFGAPAPLTLGVRPQMERTYYSILEVTESASTETIRGAYRYLAQRWHPDKNPLSREEADRITKELNNAYEVLSNPQTRSAYDRVLASQRVSNLASEAPVSDTGPRETAPTLLPRVQQAGVFRRTWLMFLFVISLAVLLFLLPYMLITEGFKWGYIPGVLIWAWGAKYSYQRLFGTYELQRWETVTPPRSHGKSSKRLIRAALLGAGTGAATFVIFAALSASGSQVLFGIEAFMFFVFFGIIVGLWRFR